MVCSVRHSPLVSVNKNMKIVPKAEDLSYFSLEIKPQHLELGVSSMDFPAVSLAPLAIFQGWMFPISWFLWASNSNLFSFFFELQPLCSAVGMVPKAQWAVGSPTWTPKTAWPRTPGTHEKFQEQSKSIQSHSSEDPPTMVLCGTIPPWTLFAVFLSCTMPCLPPAHVCILGWTSPERCYPDAAGPEHSFLPNAGYKSSLPTLHDNPFMISSLIFAIQIL